MFPCVCGQGSVSGHSAGAYGAKLSVRGTVPSLPRGRAGQTGLVQRAHLHLQGHLGWPDSAPGRSGLWTLRLVGRLPGLREASGHSPETRTCEGSRVGGGLAARPPAGRGGCWEQSLGPRPLINTCHTAQWPPSDSAPGGGEGLATGVTLLLGQQGDTTVWAPCRPVGAT